jgi:hypothetical protein
VQRMQGQINDELTFPELEVLLACIEVGTRD